MLDRRQDESKVVELLTMIARSVEDAQMKIGVFAQGMHEILGEKTAPVSSELKVFWISGKDYLVFVTWRTELR